MPCVKLYLVCGYYLLCCLCFHSVFTNVWLLTYCSYLWPRTKTWGLWLDISGRWGPCCVAGEDASILASWCLAPATATTRYSLSLSLSLSLQPCWFAMYGCCRWWSVVCFLVSHYDWLVFWQGACLGPATTTSVPPKTSTSKVCKIPYCFSSRAAFIRFRLWCGKQFRYGLWFQWSQWFSYS
jgi:hypothetical protein